MCLYVKTILYWASLPTDCGVNIVLILNEIYQMKNGLIILLFGIVGVVSPYSARCQNTLKPAELYQRLSNGNAEELSALLEIVGEPESTRQRAIKGVILMKNAGYQSSPGDKLATFKEGHALLEKAIAEEPANIEYLFFRLLIQENAPRVLGYHDKIETDASAISTSFKSLSQELKNAILAYSKTSKALNAEDLD